MSQAAIAWILQQDGVHSVIAGASTPEQVVTNSNLVKLPQVIIITIIIIIIIILIK